MDSCPFCDAQVLEDDFPDHARWHIAHGLHRHNCARLYTVDASEYCDCGLDNLKDLG